MNTSPAATRLSRLIVESRGLIVASLMLAAGLATGGTPTLLLREGFEDGNAGEFLRSVSPAGQSTGDFNYIYSTPPSPGSLPGETRALRIDVNTTDDSFTDSYTIQRSSGPVEDFIVSFDAWVNFVEIDKGRDQFLVFGFNDGGDYQIPPYSPGPPFAGMVIAINSTGEATTDFRLYEGNETESAEIRTASKPDFFNTGTFTDEAAAPEWQSLFPFEIPGVPSKAWVNYTLRVKDGEVQVFANAGGGDVLIGDWSLEGATANPYSFFVGGWDANAGDPASPGNFFLIDNIEFYAVDQFSCPYVDQVSVSDPVPGGDGDGFAEPGELIEVSYRLTNPGPSNLTNVTAMVSSTSPDIEVVSGMMRFGTIGLSYPKSSVQKAILRISPTASCTAVGLDLSITSNEGSCISFAGSITPGSTEDSTVLYEDFETGGAGWTYDGLWHVENDPTCAQGIGRVHSISGTHSAVFNSPSVCNYSGTWTSAITLTDGVLIPPGAASAQLSWWEMNQVENANSYDDVYVEVSTDGTNWSPLATRPGSGDWEQVAVSLDAYIGSTIQIRYVFATVDNFANETIGWYLDDIRITASGASCNLFSPSGAIVKAIADPEQAIFGTEMPVRVLVASNPTGVAPYSFDGQLSFPANGSVLGFLPGNLGGVNSNTPVPGAPGYSIVEVETAGDDQSDTTPNVFDVRFQVPPVADFPFSLELSQGSGQGLIDGAFQPIATLFDNTITTGLGVYPLLYGDANADTVVDGADVAMIYGEVLAGTPITNPNRNAADVNRDGEIDHYDAAAVAQFVGGAPTALPLEPPIPASFGSVTVRPRAVGTLFEGDLFSIVVEVVSNSSRLPLGACAFRLDYDPADVEFVDAVPVGALLPGQVFTYDDGSSVHVGAVNTAGDGLALGDLVQVNLRKRNNNFPVSIFVQPAGSVPFLADETLRWSPVANIDNDLIDYMDATGLGDVNEDGIVNTDDARAVGEYVAGRDPGSPFRAISADVDFDGVITPRDASYIWAAAGRDIDLPPSGLSSPGGYLIVDTVLDDIVTTAGMITIGAVVSENNIGNNKEAADPAIPVHFAARFRYDHNALSVASVAEADLGEVVWFISSPGNLDVFSIGNDNRWGAYLPRLATVQFSVLDPTSFPTDIGVTNLDSNPAVIGGDWDADLLTFFYSYNTERLGYPTTIGDVNQDDLVNSDDVYDLANYLIEIQSNFGLNIFNGEVNGGSGLPSTLDAQILSAFVQGLVGMLPHPPPVSNDTGAITVSSVFEGSEIVGGDTFEVRFEVSANSYSKDETPGAFSGYLRVSDGLTVESVTDGDLGEVLLGQGTYFGGGEAKGGFFGFTQYPILSLGNVQNTNALPRLFSARIRLNPGFSGTVWVNLEPWTNSLVHTDLIQTYSVGYNNGATDPLPGPYRLGDLDRDTYITYNDAAILLTDLTGGDSTYDYDERRADVDRSSEAQPLDAAYIAYSADGGTVLPVPSPAVPVFTDPVVVAPMLETGDVITTEGSIRLLVKAFHNGSGYFPEHFAFEVTFPDDFTVESVAADTLGTVVWYEAAPGLVRVANYGGTGSTISKPNLFIIQFHPNSAFYEPGPFTVEVRPWADYASVVGNSLTRILPTLFYNRTTSALLPTDLLGDVNNDGIVDVNDLAELSTFLVSDGYPITNSVHGEVNQDGIVNNADLVALNDYLNGFEPSLPVSEPSLRNGGLLGVSTALVDGYLYPGETITVRVGVDSNSYAEANPTAWALDLVYPFEALDFISVQPGDLGEVAIGWGSNRIHLMSFGDPNNTIRTPNFVDVTLRITDDAPTSFTISLAHTPGMYTVLGDGNDFILNAAFDSSNTTGLELESDPPAPEICSVGTPVPPSPIPGTPTPTPAPSPTPVVTNPQVFDLDVTTSSLMATFTLPPDDGNRYSIGFWSRRLNNPADGWVFLGLHEFTERSAAGSLDMSELSIGWDPLPGSSYSLRAQMHRRGVGYMGPQIYATFTDLGAAQLPVIDAIAFDEGANQVVVTFATPGTLSASIGFWYRPMITPTTDDPIVPASGWVYRGLTPYPLQATEVRIPFDPSLIAGGFNTFEISAAVYVAGTGFLAPYTIDFAPGDTLAYAAPYGIVMNPATGSARQMFSPVGNQPAKAGFWYRELDANTCEPLCDWKFLGLRDLPNGARDLVRPFYPADPINPGIVYQGATRLYRDNGEIQGYIGQFFIVGDCEPKVRGQ